MLSVPIYFGELTMLTSQKSNQKGTIVTVTILFSLEHDDDCIDDFLNPEANCLFATIFSYQFGLFKLLSSKWAL